MAPRDSPISGLESFKSGRGPYSYRGVSRGLFTYHISTYDNDRSHLEDLLWCSIPRLHKAWLK